MKKILSIANSPYSAFSLLVISGALLAAMLLAKQASAVINVPTWDVTGNYNIGFQLTGDLTTYTHDASLTQTGTSVSGNGGYPAGGPHTFEWAITSGSVTGNTINLTMDYTMGAPGTTMHMTGTIASDGSMSGTWDDNYGGGTRTGTWATSSGTAFRNIPEECEGMTFDTFTKGTGGPNTLNGTSGRDLILGLGGNDTINGSSSDDCLDGGGNVDTINGGSGNDVILGGGTNDNLNGSTGDDKIYGQAGSDDIVGDSGNDWLRGGNGLDTMNGGSGNDTIVGGDDADSANGATGTDACNAETETSCETDPV